ncbi:MAG TPA: hypothetical protein VJN92_24395 [Candidatus Acidoferrum sp.]|nr:hypothetical protein [Candidatus Acidoferrum sp.]
MLNVKSVRGLFRFTVSLLLLLLAASLGFAQEPAQTSPEKPSAPDTNQTTDPDNQRVRVTRFVITPNQTLTLPVLSNESLVICLRGESLSRIPIQGPEEKWACGPGNVLSNRSGAPFMLANSATTPAEILAVELKDSFAIAQLRVPWSVREPLNEDPGHFRVVFENSHARVLHLHLNPREGTVESQFADRLEIALSNMHESSTDVDGKNHDVRHNAGAVGWRRSVMYSTVNIGDQPLDESMVELRHPFCYELPENDVEMPGATPSMKAYVEKVKDAIGKKWMKHMPSGVRGGDDKGLVLLQFKIEPGGTLIEDSLLFRIVFANDSLMEKALTAVREASPFPPVPADFNKPFFGERYVFMYNLPRHPPGCH